MNSKDRKLFEQYQYLVPMTVYKRFWWFREGALAREDLVSVGLIGLLKAIRTYKEGSFKTYAISCIHNRITDEIRVMNKNRGKLRLEFVPITEDLKYYPRESPIDEEYLLSEIEKLPPKECKVIKEHFYEGLHLYEIAQALGVSDARCSQILTSAKRALRKRLNRKNLS